VGCGEVGTYGFPSFPKTTPLGYFFGRAPEPAIVEDVAPEVVLELGLSRVSSAMVVVPQNSEEISSVAQRVL
jgi:hypothetical protein